MPSYEKRIKWFNRLFSFLLIGYGLKTIVTQEMSAFGSRMRGAGWALYGAEAVFVGAVILAAGVYMLIVTITTKSK